MSFILDALRKVDEGNRRSGEVLPPVAAVERLRNERLHRRRQLGAMAVIAVLSAAATALILRKPPGPEPVQPSAPAQPATVVESPIVDAKIPSADAAVPERAPDPPRPAERAAAAPTGKTATPVASEAKPPPGPPQLVLQGTSVLDGRPVAVVSDRRVFEGDTIDGAVVIRIEERSVVLEFEGRRFTLTL